MKKILALLLALIMLFAMTACGENEEIIPTGNGNTGGNQTSTEGNKDNTGSTEAPAGGANNSTGGNTNTPADKEDNDGTLDNFEPTATKFTREELLAVLDGYTGNANPDREDHHEDGLYPEDENGFKKTYLVKTFAEDHALNLFLHTTNEAAAKMANGWATIDRFDYEFIDRTKYTTTFYYTITCEALTQAIEYAKNDGYRMASFYGLSLDAMKYTVNSGKQKKEVQLTDTVLGKLATGEYTNASGSIKLPTQYEDSCKIEINIAKKADGQYEYSYKVMIQAE